MGLVVGACLAETGNDVICADVVESKIEGLKRNVLPIYEPGLDTVVERNQKNDRLRFTTDLAETIKVAAGYSRRRQDRTGQSFHGANK